MKTKIKKLNWSEKIVDRAKAKKMKQFFMTIMGIMLFLLIAIPASSEDVSIKDTAAPTAMTATIMGAVGTINSVTNDQKVGKKIGYNMYIISADQVDVTTFPARNDFEISTIPLLAGEYWSKVGTVVDSSELKISGAEGDIASLITSDLNFTLGGINKKILKLLETGVGGLFYVVLEECGTTDKYILGTKCKPAKLKSFEGGLLKDYTGANLVFSTQGGSTISYYTGTTSTQAASVVAANATAVPLTSAEEYQLTSGTAAAATITTMSGVTANDVNRVVTFYGSGGTYPSTITSANSFILIDGTTWTADTGKRISFKIFKDGVSSYKFVEINGSRN